MTAAALEVNALTAGYGPVTAVDEVTLSARAGRLTAVLGANGAGKTSLLRAVSGLLRPARGTVLLDGADVTRTPPERRACLGLAHVPEGRGVIVELTVEENLRLGGLVDRGGPGPDHVWQLFPPLAERRRMPAHTLSGGERQMLALGRALMAAPSVLLLDEPSLGLAPRVVQQLFTLVRSLVDRDGLAVVLVEQNARSALSVADDAVVLSLGRVVARGPAASLAADEALRHAYLGF